MIETNNKYINARNCKLNYSTNWKEMQNKVLYSLSNNYLLWILVGKLEKLREI